MTFGTGPTVLKCWHANTPTWSERAMDANSPALYRRRMISGTALAILVAAALVHPLVCVPLLIAWLYLRHAPT